MTVYQSFLLRFPPTQKTTVFSGVSWNQNKAIILAMITNEPASELKVNTCNGHQARLNTYNRGNIQFLVLQDRWVKRKNTHFYRVY